MTFTEINTEINVLNRDEDCVALALLSLTAQQHVTNLLTELSAKLGDIIWPMPALALHTTLCEIIQPKPYTTDKIALHQHIHDDYEIALGEILAEQPPITVLFNKIVVSPQAISVHASDASAFNNIRHQLVTRLPLPAETKVPPDVVHTSIIRFKRAVDIEKVVSVVARSSISFTETIQEFQLLHRTAPHLLAYDVAQRYPLTA